MLGPFQFFAEYGTADTFFFTLQSPSGTDDDTLLEADPTFSAGADSLISKDGGAVAATTNDPAYVDGNTFSIAITAAEMAAEYVLITIVDAAGGPDWRALTIIIQTKLRLSEVDIDATAIGGNTSALKLTGVGTGFGLQTEGASDAYETNIFDQLEGTEPAGEPADNASFGAILREIKRRFVNAIDQTRTAQTAYKDDSATIRWTRTISDDGTTFSIGKVS